MVNIEAIRKMMQSPSKTKPTTVPKAPPNTGMSGAISSVPLPIMPQPNRPLGLPGKTTSGVTLPNMNLASANPTSKVTVPNGYSAANPGGGYQPSPTGGVTLPRTEQTLNTQAGLVNTPWNYNAAEDQSLQAAIRDADNKLLINQKNTNAQLRATGQGKSSYSETVANQLANQSAENIANTLVPQYESMAYKKEQDRIGNLRNLYSDQYQQDVTKPLSESDRTGIYQDAQTKDDLFQIMMYKAEAEAPGTTAARKAELNALANQKRASLDSRGIDSTQVGANVNSKNINSSGIGIRTLAGQAQDQSAKNANLDAATAVSNMTGKVITPQTDWQGLVRQASDPNTPLNASQGNFNRQQTFNEGQQNWSNQFDQAKFDEDTRRYGLDYALQQQQINISGMNANTSRAGSDASIANSQFGQLMDVWKATGVAPSGLEQLGVQSGTPYSTGAAAKASAPKTYEDFQSEIEKVAKNNKKNPAIAQDYIKSLPVSNYEKYRAWIASGYEWPANVEVPTPGE